MKYFLIIINIASVIFINSQQNKIQNINVNYDLIVRSKINTVTPTTLYIDNDISMFTVFSPQVKELDVKAEDQKGCETCPKTAILMPGKDNYYYYQDLDKHKQYSSYTSFQKKFNVEEDLMSFSIWVMGEKQKEILGYKCQNATIIYKEREWEVYFTNQIPVQFGPWKFSGLSGLILEAKSLDGIYNYTATKINFESVSNIFNKNSFNDYVKQNTITTWQEYYDLVNKKLYDRNKNAWSTDDETGSSMVVIEPTMEKIFDKTNEKVRAEYKAKWGSNDK